MNRNLRNAWISVALIVVAAVAAIAVGEGVMSALGYSGDEDPPLWAALVVGVPLSFVAAAPAVFAVVFGRRARAEGARAGATVAIVIGTLVTAYWVITTVGSLAIRAFD